MRRVKELGSPEMSNRRTLNQLILSEIIPCCQLQMGMTEIHSGSVWNTMPPHTHSRRNGGLLLIPKEQAVRHFMGSLRRHVIYSCLMNRQLFHCHGLYAVRQVQVIIRLFGQCAEKIWTITIL
jgi:5-keto 4-deoxyuronate isomerase